MGDPDFVVVGGGIAGGTFATVMAQAGANVLVLERQAEYRDRVRGELWPWGVAEVQRLGLEVILRRRCERRGSLRAFRTRTSPGADRPELPDAAPAWLWFGCAFDRTCSIRLHCHKLLPIRTVRPSFSPAS